MKKKRNKFSEATEYEAYAAMDKSFEFWSKEEASEEIYRCGGFLYIGYVQRLYFSEN